MNLFAEVAALPRASRVAMIAHLLKLTGGVTRHELEKLGVRECDARRVSTTKRGDQPRRVRAGHIVHPRVGRVGEPA